MLIVPGVMGWPSRNCSAPSMTTLSPELRPESISTSTRRVCRCGRCGVGRGIPGGQRRYPSARERRLRRPERGSSGCRRLAPTRGRTVHCAQLRWAAGRVSRGMSGLRRRRSGAISTTVPSTGALPLPTRTGSFASSFTWPMSASGTSASKRSALGSSISMIGLPGAARSPTSASLRVTMPSKGATSLV